jgi:hypothetical protein
MAIADPFCCGDRAARFPKRNGRGVNEVSGDPMSCSPDYSRFRLAEVHVCCGRLRKHSQTMRTIAFCRCVAMQIPPWCAGRPPSWIRRCPSFAQGVAVFFGIEEGVDVASERSSSGLPSALRRVRVAVDFAMVVTSVTIRM